MAAAAVHPVLTHDDNNGRIPSLPRPGSSVAQASGHACAAAAASSDGHKMYECKDDELPCVPSVPAESELQQAAASKKALGGAQAHNQQPQHPQAEQPNSAPAPAKKNLKKKGKRKSAAKVNKSNPAAAAAAPSHDNEEDDDFESDEEETPGDPAAEGAAGHKDEGAARPAPGAGAVGNAPQAAVVAAAADAAAAPQHAGAVAIGRTLDCSVCENPFEPVEGLRYPRILAPCAHTFCTECIQRRLAQQGGAAFHCLSHDQAIVGITKAEDVKANFALIALLELVRRDADHRQVDERAEAPPCAGCALPARWFCKTDNACFCDAHHASAHSEKWNAHHTVVPVSERHAEAPVPKCPHHKKKDLDMWCTLCQEGAGELCCSMCAHFGKHKEHLKNLMPVDDIIAAKRARISEMEAHAKEVLTKQLDTAAEALLKQRDGFEQSAAAATAAVQRQTTTFAAALAARSAALHESIDVQKRSGLAHYNDRLDHLTECRSEMEVVRETSARVQLMPDYAALSHEPGVESLVRKADAKLRQFNAESSLPNDMTFLTQPELVLDEIAVAGSAHVAHTRVRDGNVVVDPDVKLHALELSERSKELADLRAGAQSNAVFKDELKQLKEQSAAAQADAASKAAAAIEAAEARARAAEESAAKLGAQVKGLEKKVASDATKLTEAAKAAEEAKKHATALKLAEAKAKAAASTAAAGASIDAQQRAGEYKKAMDKLTTDFNAKMTAAIAAAEEHKKAAMAATQSSLEHKAKTDKLTLEKAALEKQLADLKAEKGVLDKKAAAAADASTQLKILLAQGKK